MLSHGSHIQNLVALSFEQPVVLIKNLLVCF